MPSTKPEFVFNGEMFPQRLGRRQGVTIAGMLLLAPIFVVGAGCGDDGGPSPADSVGRDTGPVVCEPYTSGCDDGDSLFECNADGTHKTVTPCGEGRFCDDGQCFAPLCEPATSRCAVDGVATCAEDKLGEEFTACASTSACAASDYGCTCVEGACEARVCIPYSARCDGAGQQTCAPDGRSWLATRPCSEGMACVEALGNCVAPTCTPGDQDCFGEVRAVCDEAGTTWTPTDCAATHEVCLAGTESEGARVCGAPVCEPDSVGCGADGVTVTRCDPRGASEFSFLCAAGQACRDGGCVNLAAGCPTAVITSTLGAAARPGTTVFLKASDSIAKVGFVDNWEWRVKEPRADGFKLLSPGAFADSLSFDLSTIGEYLFTLSVWDSTGQKSCEVATYSVVVAPETGLYVELTWDTPEDADQTDTGRDIYGDSVGADLDLHFLHPMAEGKIFAATYDAVWINMTPDWGEAGELNDPVVARVDDDGAGPEVLVLETPEANTAYTVAVHVWDDWAFGPSVATVRIYIDGVLTFTSDSVSLVNKELWEVATIAWPSKVITALEADGQPKIYLWNEL